MILSHDLLESCYARSGLVSGRRDRMGTLGCFASARLGEQSLADLEDHIIAEVLQRSDGNKTLAAKHLGITRWMLDRRRKP